MAARVAGCALALSAAQLRAALRLARHRKIQSSAHSEQSAPWSGGYCSVAVRCRWEKLHAMPPAPQCWRSRAAPGYAIADGDGPAALLLAWKRRAFRRFAPTGEQGAEAVKDLMDRSGHR